MKASKPHPLRTCLGLVGLSTTLMMELLKAAWQTLKAIYAPRGSIQPAILAVPLDAHSPMGIAFFANMITLTPGTTTLEVSDDRRILYVHALDAPDPEATIQDMKDALESAVQKVFP